MVSSSFAAASLLQCTKDDKTFGGRFDLLIDMHLLHREILLDKTAMLVYDV